MPAQKKNPHVKPYPYKIPPVQCPTEEVVNQLDPWLDVLEFFRIEALLRSTTVHDLYKKKKKGQPGYNGNLFTFFGFTWSVLKGEHHNLFKPKNERITSGGFGLFFSPVFDPPLQKIPGVQEWTRSGKVNLGAIAKAKMKEADRRGKANNEDYIWLGKYISELARSNLRTKGSYLLLGIDSSAPPTKVLQTLKGILDKHHKPDDFPGDYRISWPPKEAKIEGEKYVRYYPLPYHDHKKLRMADYTGIKTWINFFKCYDLRIEKGLSFGQIGKTIFGEDKKSSNHYEKAEKAVNRVAQLIASAESMDWPPRKIK